MVKNRNRPNDYDDKTDDNDDSDDENEICRTSMNGSRVNDAHEAITKSDGKQFDSHRKRSIGSNRSSSKQTSSSSKSKYSGQSS